MFLSELGNQLGYLSSSPCIELILFIIDRMVDVSRSVLIKIASLEGDIVFVVAVFFCTL